MSPLTGLVGWFRGCVVQGFRFAPHPAYDISPVGLGVARKGLGWWFRGFVVQGFRFAPHPAYDSSPVGLSAAPAGLGGGCGVALHRGSASLHTLPMICRPLGWMSPLTGLWWWLWGCVIQGFRFASRPAYDIAPTRGFVATRTSPPQFGLSTSRSTEATELPVQKAYSFVATRTSPTLMGVLLYKDKPHNQHI
jgi:hypothetical protein